MAKNPKIGVAGVIKNSQGNLLAIRRGHEPQEGRWALPGGHVEWGESLAQALRREIWEEASLEVNPQRLLYVAEIRLPHTHFIVLDFAATIVGSDRVSASSDASQACWIPVTSLQQFSWAEGMEAFFQDDMVRAYLCL